MFSKKLERRLTELFADNTGMYKWEDAWLYFRFKLCEGFTRKDLLEYGKLASIRGRHKMSTAQLLDRLMTHVKDCENSNSEAQRLVDLLYPQDRVVAYYRHGADYEGWELNDAVYLGLLSDLL